MDKCPNCGASVAKSDKCCSKCGTTLESTKSSNSSSKLIIGVVALIIVIAIVAVFASGMLSNNNMQSAPASSSNDAKVINPTNSNDSSSSSVFWASSRTDKFHKPTCEWAQKIDDSNKIVYDSRDKAISAGKTPCSVCNP